MTAPALWAACDFSLSASNVTINWDLNFASMAVQITIDKAGADACDFGIGISAGGGTYSTRRGVSGSSILRYQIYSDNGLSKIVKDVPDITAADDMITGGFQAGTGLSQQILYYIEIPVSLATTPTLVSAGTFVDTYVVNLYEGSDPMAFVTPVDSANITFTVNVDKMINLSLVDSGGSFNVAATSRNVNFGTLQEGLAAYFDLRVRTNAGFSITFSSTNDGRMKHPTKNSYVPYSFYANAALLNLTGSSSTPVTGLSGSGQTSLSGLAYPIRIVVGSLSGGVVSGTHQDDITITATTTE